MSRRLKEEKNEKKKTKLKVRWRTWMTVIAVIFGVTIISGSTVLGVYLSGGFEEKNIQPAEINFNFEDNDIAGVQTLNVDEDFELTITTPTKGVTRRNIELSFDNSRTQRPDENGNISNGSIQVPQMVEIGTPFTVHLLSSDLKDEKTGQPITEEGKNVPWIKGGISSLYAFSENTLIGSKNIKIAVDVPVYKTELEIINSKGEVTTSIVKNERFTVRTKFIPSTSEYLYSEQLSEENPRVKKSYYQAVDVNTNTLATYYDDKDNIHFVAGDNLESNGIKIESYTFAHAKEQLDYEEQNSDIDDPFNYYTEALAFFKDKVDDVCQSSNESITIGEETVGNFTVAKESQSINLVIGETLKLYIKNYPYERYTEYLGAAITSRGGQYLDNLLSNIALRFVDKEGKDVINGDESSNSNLTVKGGNILTINNNKYIKPICDEGKNPEYSYWELSAKSEEEIEVEVVLVVGENELFKLSSQENTSESLVRKFKLKITKEEAKPVNWADPSDKEVYLKYEKVDDKNVLMPENIYLEDYISPLDKEHVFFAWFSGENAGDTAINQVENEEFIKKVEAAIGTGYDKSKSGVYTLPSNGQVTLIALNGSRLTLFNTCSLSIYCATVRQNLKEGGLYEVIEFTSIPKKIICEKSLYENSITSYTTDFSHYSNPNGQGNEDINIDQGNTATFTLDFNIEDESLPVFTEEYERGHISKPKIYDKSGNDISKYFLFSTNGITQATDTGDGQRQPAKLSYTVTTVSSINIEDTNGINFGSYELTYQNGENVINWRLYLANNEKVCLYKPIAEKITLETTALKTALEGATGIKAEQQLTQEGVFKLTISVEGAVDTTTNSYESIQSFLKALFDDDAGKIKITDQKGKETTLAGQWKFVIKEGGSMNAIELSEDKKSFTFRNTNSDTPEEVTLLIKSSDDHATVMRDNSNDQQFELKFKVKSQGITSLKYDSNKSPYSDSHTYEASNKINAVTVTKYGAKAENKEGGGEQKIELAKLLQFFVKVNGENDVEYKHIAFKISPQYYTNLTDDQLVDLFGEDGMLTLYSDEHSTIEMGEDAESIKTAFAGKEIVAVKINKDFAKAHTLLFTVTDKNSQAGAVNTEFSLLLDKNVEVSNSETYTGYAGVEIELKNTITNHNNSGSSNKTLADLLNKEDPNKTYYIVLVDREYNLVEGQSDNAIGEYSNGKIKFYDFWDKEEQPFTVNFHPDGNNDFTINQPIRFTIKRNLDLTKIRENKKTQFNLLDTQELKIDDFVALKRAEAVKTQGDGTTDAINNVPIYYEFNQYLSVDSSTQKITSAPNLFFDYNVKTLKSILTLRYQNANGVELTHFTIDIVLGSDNTDIYSQLANCFAAQEKNYPPIIQIINGVEYIVFNSESSGWSIKELKSGTNEYSVLSSQLDYHNVNMTNIYSLTSANGNISRLALTTRQDVLFGVNNKTSYIAFQIRKKGASTQDGNIATLHVPLIISKLGYDTVVYDSVDAENKPVVDSEHRLEKALTKPEDLVGTGVYNTLTAGELSNILTKYKSEDYMTGDTFTRNHFTKGGLYRLENNGIKVTIEPYSIRKINIIDYINLIKKVVDETSSTDAGNILLNHLDTDIKDAYIALEVKFTNTSNSSYEQVMYYLVKVIGDVEADASLYAFGGSKEYVDGDRSKETSLDLEELFNRNTLHADQKRFEVNKIVNLVENEDDATDMNFDITSLDGKEGYILLTYNGEEQIVKLSDGKLYYGKNYAASVEAQDGKFDLSQIFPLATTADEENQMHLAILSGDLKISYNEKEMLRSLKYKNTIERVRVETNEFTDEKEWSKHISLKFSNDYKTLNYKPLSDKSMEIVIRHSYIGGGDNDLSVIGGDQLYTIVINEKDEIYAVKFSGFNEDKESTDRQITVRNSAESLTHNGSAEGPTRAATENWHGLELKVELIRKDSLGATSGDTVTYENTKKLSISLIEGEEAFDTVNHPDKLFDYSNKEGDCTLKAYFKDYIEKDITVRFSIYTDHGYLASLTIFLQANIEYINKVNNVKLDGGTTKNWADLFTLKNGTTDVNDYTVDAEILSGTNDGDKLVSIKSDNSKQTGITIANLISTERTVTIGYTIKFKEKEDDTEEKKFYFTETYTLKPNITPVESITATKEAIAGDKTTGHEIIEELFTDSNAKTNGYTKPTYTLAATSTNTAFDTIEGSKIKTKYVSQKGTIDVTLTVKFTFDYETGKTTEQTFNVKYSLVVVPSVEIKVAYPQPNKNKDALTVEYVDNNATFNNITDNFFKNSAIFSNTPRVSIYEAELTGNNVTYKTTSSTTWNTNENYSITISDKSSKAKIYAGNSEASTNTQISASSSIRLSRDDDSENEEYVVFALSYQNVTCTYKVIIVKQKAISVNLQTVSNNIYKGTYKPAGNGKSEEVNSEVIYIDRVDLSGLFDKERLIQVNLKASQTEGNYYFVFKKDSNGSTNFYVSNSIYLSSEHFGKNVYLDLGSSFEGYEFVGIYSADSFEGGTYRIGDPSKAVATAADDNDKPDKMIYKQNESNKETYDAVTDVGNLPSNLKDQMILGDSRNSSGYKVTQRLEMYYGYGTDGTQNYVDNGKFDNILKGINDGSAGKAKLTVTKLGDIEKLEISVNLEKGDGSVDIYNRTTINEVQKDGQPSYEVQSTTLYTNRFEQVISYYYRPTIDIEMTEAASTLANYKEVEAWKEQRSIIELFGLRHVTNKKKLAASDLTNGKIDLSVVEENLDDDSVLGTTIYNAYNVKSGITFTTKTNAKKNNVASYIKTTSIQNSSNNIYDWRFIPQGAKNDGDYLLLKVTYTSTNNIDGANKGLSTSFYTVIKIKPDYEVRFGTTDGNYERLVVGSGDVYTANTKPYIIYTTNSTYPAFTLTGDGTENNSNGGYFTIKHKNADKPVDVSITGFDVSMPIGESIDGIEYNSQTNIKNQLFKTTTHGKFTFTENGNPQIKFNGGARVTSDAEEIKAATQFSGVPKVVFGDQVYMIKGEDDFGYKYMLFFTLKSSSNETPSAVEELQIEEGGYFDIGLNYRTLSFTEVGKDKNQSYQIQATDVTTPEAQGSEVKLVKIKGIDSWHFNKSAEKSAEEDYIEMIKCETCKEKDTCAKDCATCKDAGCKCCLKNYGDPIYKAKADKTVNEIDTNAYFRYPISHFIALTKVALYNGNDIIWTYQGESDGSNGSNTSKLPEGYRTKQNGTEMFATVGDYQFGEIKTRGPENSADGNSKYLFKMPRITNTDIFGAATSAKLTLVLTFGFNSTGIWSDNSVRNDFEEIYECPVNVTLSRQVEFEYQDLAVRDGTSFSLSNLLTYKNGDTSPKVSYLNDTLEVVVPHNSSISFNMELKRSNSSFAKAYVELQSSSNFDRTFYVSMSDKFGTNVHENDTVEITSVSNTGVQFYYVKGNANDATLANNSFTISTITNDIIYVDHTDLLSNGFNPVTKYYIAKDGNYLYRVSAKYKVTGKVFSLENAQPSDNAIACLENQHTSGQDVATWNAGGAAFKAYKGTAQNGAETVTKDGDITSNCSNLYFEAGTKGDDTSGLATIAADGTITLKQTLNNNYISINIYLMVSGSKRGKDIKGEDNNINYSKQKEYGLKLLLTLKLTATTNT